MNKVKEIIEKINNAGIYTPHDLRELGVMDGVKFVVEMDYDEHRWYVVGTRVFKVGDEYFGVRGPVSSKSESQDWSDIGWNCTAFEMEQVPSVTYRRKGAV